MFHVHCCCPPSRSTASVVAQSTTAVGNTNAVQRANANMTTVTCRSTTVTVTSVGLNEDSSPDAVAASSSQLRGWKTVLGACSDLRRTSSRDGLHPSRAAMHDAPEPILEYITPAPVRIAVIAVIAASAPEAEHIAPASAGITGPAPVVGYIPPTPAVSYAAPAPTGYAAAAPMVEYVCQYRASNQPRSTNSRPMRRSCHLCSNANDDRRRGRPKQGWHPRCAPSAPALLRSTNVL